MKTKHLFSILLISALSGGCSGDFLERVPQGELVTDQLATPEGVEGLLVGAYGLLNGNVNGTWGNYSSGPSQWLFGEVAADNAHKGSNNGDQPNMNQIELYQVTSTNDNLEVMWNRQFEGIARCNNVLRMVATVQAGSGKNSPMPARWKSRAKQECCADTITFSSAGSLTKCLTSMKH
ncbi:hypothetical protein MKQ70_16215 [Chitinophaga sedimenti]|uniref:hypothetical protein n=1 Tax=Chitinophaga sedimenti TaxID=2033606 RepID=UPI002003F3CE|nr:hypothetical protein [Chitinophaga sedimenti]MCK7556476.1 hypothetical protein [Chitinophaga sedimenti]